MFFAKRHSSGLIPKPSRLKSLLWAGAATAISLSYSYAQDASRDEDLPPNIPSASDTLATDDFTAGNITEPDMNDAVSYEPPKTATTLAGAPPVQTVPALVTAEEEEALQSVNIRIGAVTDDTNEDREFIRRENLRQAPEQGRGPAQESDPFAPIGIRAGSFILRPSLEQGIRATSNGDNSPSGSSATVSETTMRLNARSDWSRHQLSIAAAGTMKKSISGQSVNEPQIDVQGNLRLDLADRTTVNAGAGYRVRRESASNPNGVVGALKRPLVHTLNGSLGVERDTGLIFGRITGRVQHDLYGDAEASSGGSISQKDRDNTYASIILRGGFTLSQALKPFAEVELGKRIFDEDRDSNGFERSGSQFAMRGGLMLDMGEKWNGEFAAGYMRVRSNDARLTDISGPSINAALNWSPLRGTNVRLFVQTTVDMSTTPDVAGSLLHYASLNVTHQIRSDLSVNGQFDTSIRQNKDGTGTDYTLGAQIGATYWLNRFMGLDARLRHEYLTSRLSEREYKSNSVYVGIKLQR